MPQGPRLYPRWAPRAMGADPGKKQGKNSLMTSVEIKLSQGEQGDKHSCSEKLFIPNAVF